MAEQQLLREPWCKAFLDRQFGDMGRPDGRCVRLQLVHLPSRFGVRTWSFDATPELSEQEHLMDEVLRLAQEHAAQMFGRQRYVLGACSANRPGEVTESAIFWRDGGGRGSDEDEIDSEGPNQKGLLTQLMRHNEVLVRTLVETAADHRKGLGNLVHELSALNQYYAGQHIAHVQAFEGMMSERHLRELATKQADVKTRLWSQAAQKLEVLAPIVVNKIVGARVLPEPAAIRNEIVWSLVGSITPQQFDQLQGVLTPEQLLSVLELIKERQRFDERMKADAEARVREAQQAPPAAAAP